MDRGDLLGHDRALGLQPDACRPCQARRHGRSVAVAEREVNGHTARSDEIVQEARAQVLQFEPIGAQILGRQQTGADARAGRQERRPSNLRRRRYESRPSLPRALHLDDQKLITTEAPNSWFDRLKLPSRTSTNTGRLARSSLYSAFIVVLALKM